ncbi:TIGR04283 family arsenosugar biosynthesis glycosyltransferase [Acidobacteriota bacterium]
MLGNAEGMMRSRRLIFFTRYPEPGKVKTRLISALGNEGAASLHHKMTIRTLKEAKFLFVDDLYNLEIRYDGATPSIMKQWLGTKLNFVFQGSGDLGQRMARSFEDAFKAKKDRVVLIGTDLPQITAYHIESAFDALKIYDMVIGPSEDGGYYLIGLKKMIPELFCSMDWGTNIVFKTTLDRAREKGLTVRQLGVLADVDIPEDLPIWERAVNQYISIIIPSLNEEKNLQQTLEYTEKIPHTEVIVADGGSRDRTIAIAEEWGAKVVRANPGRGSQMNAGAAAACGDILLFLHADSLLPRGYSEPVRKALSNPGVAGGAFALRLCPLSPMIWWIEKTVAWRTKVFGLPYGDQAIFVKASVFREMGGFADISLMEDVDFIRRLKRIGKLVTLRKPVVSSSRRFQSHGALRTTLQNKLILFGYFFGISTEYLTRMYYKK